MGLFKFFFQLDTINKTLEVCVIENIVLSFSSLKAEYCSVGSALEHHNAACILMYQLKHINHNKQ